MTALGVLLSLVCGGLGGLQLWVAARRQAHALEDVPTRFGLLDFELAASPARLAHLVDGVGDHGRRALRRSAEFDALVVAGYVFVTLGLGGVLVAVSRATLGKWMILLGLAAGAAQLVEGAALRRAASTEPAEGSTAPVATAAAVVKYLALVGAVAAFFLWPVRTWF